jgi:hypothetical protein
MVAGSIQVVVLAKDQFPTPIAPKYLQTLQFSTAYRLDQEGGDVSTRAVTSLPGAVALRQISDNIAVGSSGFVNMSSFSGLRCPPAALTITNNDFMTSLSGLEGTTASADLGAIAISGNPLMKTASSFAPLKSFLGCEGSGLAAQGFKVSNLLVLKWKAAQRLGRGQAVRLRHVPGKYHMSPLAK